MQARRAIIGLTAVIAAGMFSTGVAAARPGDNPGVEDTIEACTSIPPDRDINVTRTVHQVGRDHSVSDKVMLAGFEAGWVESHMNNLPCGDLDSLGVFQQRPSQGWGTPEQIMNVTYASTQFFTRAKSSEARNPGFAAWQIAQDVQRSCCPSRYADAEGKARAMMNEVGTSRTRFVYSNSGGQLIGKNDLNDAWVTLRNGGATDPATGRNSIGAIENGNFIAKQGLDGGWVPMAGGGQVTDVAVYGDRFAFVNTGGDVLGKDGANSGWTPLFSGGATKVVTEGDRIGVLANGEFWAKQGLSGTWSPMATGGGDIKDIAIAGDRFAFLTNGGQVHAKDGRDSTWIHVHDNATGLAVARTWIGAVVGGRFLVKQGLGDPWSTIGGSGGVSEIVISGDTFGMLEGGNFLAKRGFYGDWVTMQDGGQVTRISVDSF
nr:hypothetical protein [Kibdelosporangium sp. MJ126-NF4]CEL14532.1 putative secreted protein [Kibdelosporangium sp. MJ126-NF4]CTQ88897.1 putative secreted protein [Kibdelosporangium sp. MJ126-NF4]